MMRHFYNTEPMNFGGPGLGLISMLIWLAFFVVITFIVVRILKNHPSVGANSRDPLDIVKERYAKGEITKKEFDDLKKDLK